MNNNVYRLILIVSVTGAIMLTGCHKKQQASQTQFTADLPPKTTISNGNAVPQKPTAVVAQQAPTATSATKVPSKKYKIIVLTSKGGFGHMAACATLEKTLPDCDLKLVYPVELTFNFVKKWFLSKDSKVEESVYNQFMAGWTRTANFMIRHPVPWIFYFLQTKTENKLFRIMQQEKPDLLISLVPFVNLPAANAALRNNIPFLLITLDADLTNWLLGIHQTKHPNMLITVSQKTPRISKQLKQHKIKPDIVKEVGFTIRQDFFEPKDKAALKKNWKVPMNKPVVMLMMGGAGSNQLINYTKTLADFDKPLHILACVGRNNAIIPKLNKIKLNTNVSLQVIPFTTKVSELLAMTDVFITKPGPNSCYEAMYSGVPILIDMTCPSLFWERGTIDMINLYGRGSVIKKMKYTKTLVKKYLDEKPLMENKFRALPRFESRIKPIIYEMIKQSPISPAMTTLSKVKPANGNIVKPTKAC